MSATQPIKQDLPKTFKEFIGKFPELGEAHEKIARACESYGPLDRKTRELVKIGLSVGAGLETATPTAPATAPCTCRPSKTPARRSTGAARCATRRPGACAAA